MPLGMDADMRNEMNLLESQKNFTSFYFDLWPCLTISLVGQAVTPVFQWLKYDDPDGFDFEVISMTLMTMVRLTLGYLIIQMIFTRLGFDFLGAEIERQSN